MKKEHCSSETFVPHPLIQPNIWLLGKNNIEHLSRCHALLLQRQ